VTDRIRPPTEFKSNTDTETKNAFSDLKITSPMVKVLHDEWFAMHDLLYLNLYKQRLFAYIGRLRRLTGHGDQQDASTGAFPCRVA